MPVLPSTSSINGSLGGLTRWLAFSLAAHVAIFVWFATRQGTPTARGAATLQVSLVGDRGGNRGAGAGRTAPSLRSTADVADSAGPAAPAPAKVTVAPAIATPTLPEAPLSPETTFLVPEPGEAETTSSTVVLDLGEVFEGTGDTAAADTASGAPSSDVSGLGKSTATGGGGKREEARLARQMRPEYPPGALAKGWQGQVLLRLRVNADGSVQTVLVERSSGHDVLDRAAYRAARNWRFFPAREAGVPVAAEVKVPVVFARERD